MALFTACVLLAHPVLDAGIIDDWSYVWTAKRLAETGHLEYNGGATAMLGWQVYLGAIFIKLFGFSWTVTRLPVVLLAIGGVGLFHRFLVRLGCDARDAALVVLALSSSNIFLFTSVTFMSDIPGWVTILLCLYMGARALQADSERAAALWLAAAAVSNMLLGTVRQFAWLGTLVMVPAVLWALRKRAMVFRTGLLAWLVSLAGVAFWMRWWSHKAYALHEPLLFLHRGVLFQAPWFTLTIFAFASPVLIAFAVRSRRAWVPLAGAIAGASLGLTLPRMAGHLGVGTLGPVNELPRAWAAVLAALVFAAGFPFVHALASTWRLPTEAARPRLRLDHSELFWLLVPLSLASGLLMYTRGALWPRYWIPMTPVAGVLILWTFYRWQPGRSLPGICWALILSVLASSVVFVHTTFAWARAQVTAEQEYLAAGYPRNQLQAGFASDGIYEIQLKGYVNDARISVPRKIYVQPETALPEACLKPVWELTPSLDRRFSLADQYGGCFQPMGLPPVEYEAWFPPFHRQIVITKLAPGSAQALAGSGR